MNSTIDETTAWDLVRAVEPREPDPSAPRRVTLNSGRAWLEVDAAGTWRTSAVPTDEAHDVFEMYLPLQGREHLVVAQLAQSLDGRIATVAGHSQYVTGPPDIRRLHRLRALVDAVVIGAGTVSSDDPELTVREVQGNNPVRMVLDPNDRLDPRSGVFTDGLATTIVVRSAATSGASRTSTSEVVELPVAGAQGFEPAAVLAALRKRGLRRVLVEGGGITVSRFLQAGVLDRLHVTVAPVLLGSGCRGFTLEPIETLDQAVRPPSRRFILGEDVVFDLDLS